MDKNGLLETIPLGYDTSIKTPAQAIKFMMEQPNGAIGAVVIEQPSGISHTISIVKRNGEVYFIDPQIGKVVTLKDNLSISFGVR